MLSSGGLDSSEITCKAYELLRTKLPCFYTFSAIFPTLTDKIHALKDEIDCIKLVLAQRELTSNMHEADRLSPLDFVSKHSFDEPISDYNMYIFHALYEITAKQGVRVLLDGEDGDTKVSYGTDRLYDLGRNFMVNTLIYERKLLAKNCGHTVSTPQILKQYGIKPLISEAVVFKLQPLFRKQNTRQ